MPGDAEGLAEALGDAADAAGDALAGVLAEGDGKGEAETIGLGDGVVSVGVQPARSAAAKTTVRVSAMHFFIMTISLLK